MNGIMFYIGNAEEIDNVTSIPMPGWKPYFWRKGIMPWQVDDKVLLDTHWNIACLIDGKRGKLYTRREFLIAARPREE